MNSGKPNEQGFPKYTPFAYCPLDVLGDGCLGQYLRESCDARALLDVLDKACETLKRTPYMIGGSFTNRVPISLEFKFVGQIQQ